jgi:hypothetical protein
VKSGSVDIGSFVRRHRLAILIWFIVILLFGRVGLGVLAPNWGNWVDRAYDDIHLGMTAEEVTAILGPPNSVDTDDEKIWFRQRRVIALTFKDGRVTGKELMPLRPQSQPRFPH